MLLVSKRASGRSLRRDNRQQCSTGLTGTNREPPNPHMGIFFGFSDFVFKVFGNSKGFLEVLAVPRSFSTRQIQF